MKLINNFITKRSGIDFRTDILSNYKILNKNIYNTAVLVIGGAGTIGSSYIKQILEFKPKKTTVVDFN